MRSFIIRRASSDDKERFVRADARLPSRLYASRLATREAAAAPVEPSWLVAVFVLDILGSAELPREALVAPDSGVVPPLTVAAPPGTAFRGMLNNRSFAGSSFVDRCATDTVVIFDQIPLFSILQRRNKDEIKKIPCNSQFVFIIG